MGELETQIFSFTQMPKKNTNFQLALLPQICKYLV